MLGPRVIPYTSKRPSSDKHGDLSNRIFGEWQVLGFGGYDTKKNPTKHWVCLCSCGASTLVKQCSLVSGVSKRCKPCACKAAAKISAEMSLSKTRFKPSKHPLYSTWNGIKHRCYNTKMESFSDYGGRGIKMSKTWIRGDGLRSGFEVFIEDMGLKPFPGASIDRINVNRGYSKTNCRWASPKQQSNNTRRNRQVTLADGTTTTLALAAEIHGLREGTLRARLNRKLSHREALVKPLKASGKDFSSLPRPPASWIALNPTKGIADYSAIH
jgi:hypothetical protein